MSDVDVIIIGLGIGGVIMVVVLVEIGKCIFVFEKGDYLCFFMYDRDV